MSPTTLQEPPRIVTRKRAAAVPAEDRILGLSPAWFHLALGALLANLFALPILSYVGWFLSSLAHEMGHAAAAWLCGRPSFPAIRLDGHAAAIWREQSTWIAIVMTALLGSFAWRLRHAPVAAVAVGLAALLQLGIAFSSAKDLFCLAAGHVGELLFAGICFHRAMTGGFTHSRTERGLYSALGWYLLAKNVTLFFGLMTSMTALIDYYGSGSFGLTNDLIRIAEDHLDWAVQSVATLFFALSLSVLPTALILTVRCRDKL